MKAERGYTLVELVIYIGILGLFSLAFFSLAINISGIAAASDSAIEVNHVSRNILNLIKREVYLSQEIVTPLPGISSSYARLNYADGSVTTFGMKNGIIEIAKNDTASTTLNPESVKINEFLFTGLGDGTTSKGVKIVFVIAHDGTTEEEYSLSLESSFFSKTP